MAATVASNEPYVGKRLEDTTFEIDEAVLHSYYTGLDLPRRTDGAVPSTVLSKPDNDYIAQAGYSNRFGHLWVRQLWEFYLPLQARETYVVRGDIQDIYSKRDRNVVQFQTQIFDQNGALAARSEHHQSFLKDAAASGEVALRDPSKKPGARAFHIPEGEPFGGLQRQITVQMCGEFFYGKSNYHTDAEASKALGFKDIVVGGRMTLAYAAHVLEQRFGDDWLASGRLDVKFTNPVWANDTITAQGVVTGPLDNDPDRLGAFVWITRADGTVVLIGSASVARA